MKNGKGLKMPALGKTVEIYMMDGSDSGRWQASLSGWSGRAYKIPRGDLKLCPDLPGLSTPGVYFLLGIDDEKEKPFIYIGESDNTYKRLTQPHPFEKDGSYWTEAIAFITSDGTLEKARIKYLENRFYNIALDTKRYVVKNAVTPSPSNLTKPVRDMLEEFIINAKMILPSLGCTAFVPLPDPNEDLLYFSRNKGKGGKATGRRTEDGFWVLKGSFIYPDIASYVPERIKMDRKKYASIIDKNNILQEDVRFGSPSYAGAFVCGKNSDGPAEWKNKQGISLRELDNGDDGDDAIELLHLAGKKVSANAYFKGNQFYVCKGSEFSPTETKSCKNFIRKKRAKIISEGKVKDGHFIEDYLFDNVSQAASCLTGDSENGRDMWLYSDGQSINDKEGKK